MSVKIYVAMYQPYDKVLVIKDPHYIPIQCGKAIYVRDPLNHEYLPELGDDTGDNISVKNHPYSELTALYWMWKNDTSGPDDILGLNHYRRYYKEPDTPEGQPDELLTAETIEKWLSEVEFITNGCSTQHYEIGPDGESLYDNYKKVHHQQDMDNVLEGVKKFYPELFDVVEREIKLCGAMCPCNLVIAKKKYLDEWCEFMFTVFGYVESITDFTKQEYQGYQGRIFGFLAERLIRPWLVSKGYTSRCAPPLHWESYSQSLLAEDNNVNKNICCNASPR